MLPEEVLLRIFALACEDFKDWARSWRGVCQKFRKLDWYLENSRDAGVTMVPSPQVPTIQVGIAQAARLGHTYVVVKPGVYRESVRVTKSLMVVGCGPREQVVIDTPGWEPALVFAGLGVSHSTTLGVKGDSTGERGEVCNLTLQRRNQQQALAVVVVGGSPNIRHCSISGGVRVSGRLTRPYISHCHIHSSPSSGVLFIDQAGGTLSNCVITDHKRHGVSVEMKSTPSIVNNFFQRSAQEHIFVSNSSDPCIEENVADHISVQLNVSNRDLVSMDSSTRVEDCHEQPIEHRADADLQQETCTLMLRVLQNVVHFSNTPDFARLHGDRELILESLQANKWLTDTLLG